MVQIRHAGRLIGAATMLLLLFTAGFAQVEPVHSPDKHCALCDFAVLGHRRADLVASFDYCAQAESEHNPLDTLLPDTQADGHMPAQPDVVLLATIESDTVQVWDSVSRADNPLWPSSASRAPPLA